MTTTESPGPVKKTPPLVQLLLGGDWHSHLSTLGDGALAVRQQRLGQQTTRAPLTHLCAVFEVDHAAGFPVNPLTDSPLLNLAPLLLGLDGVRLVLEGEVGEGLGGAVHLRDQPLDGDCLGVALLPGDVPAVVIPCPDLLSIDHLPEAGALLPGHVLAVVPRLVVVLQHVGLLAQRQVLHLHDRSRGGHLVLLLPDCHAIAEELHLVGKVNEYWVVLC